MAFGLAVYASPGSLPHHDARLASGCWSGSTGWAFHPQDSYERFQSCCYISSPSPKLLGTMFTTDVGNWDLHGAFGGALRCAVTPTPPLFWGAWSVGATDASCGHRGGGFGRLTDARFVRRLKPVSLPRCLSATGNHVIPGRCCGGPAPPGNANVKSVYGRSGSLPQENSIRGPRNSQDSRR